MHKQISSTSNPFVKEIVTLFEKSRERKKKGFFIIEGVREITLAIQSNYEIDTIIYNSEILKTDIRSIINQSKNTVEVTKEVYEKIAYRGTTEGVMAKVAAKDTSLSKITFTTSTPLILVAEAPEKPGNIGAILRTADAAKVDAVFIANPRTDIYNPNIIRSSVGCVFTNQIATGNTDEIIAFLKEQNCNIYSAILQESQPYHLQDFTNPTAIVVATEATGLSQAWRDQSTTNIHIPMQGAIDSMNVSVAAAILIFEAKRQRDFRF